ncbi:MAG: patatin-like phospholipase family protein, partial [Hyphomicrobiaceae bacterium]
IAPFAFLGSAYDRQLKEIYTLYSTKDILRPQVLAGLTGGSAISSTEPLKKLIARYVDRKLITAIAREHAKGRRLLVGTTNIDAERPVVWDMGRIAQLGSQKSVSLFRSILLASAALPGLFPPVYVKVTADGQSFEEMHVDGGTTENAFLLPVHLDLSAIDRKRGRRPVRRLYIITNDKTGPSPETTKSTALGIAGRSIATLIKQQTQGDLIKLYLRARSNRISYNLVSIPASFHAKGKEPFDKAYMRKLFKLGFETAKSKLKWRNKPSGI